MSKLTIELQAENTELFCNLLDESKLVISSVNNKKLITIKLTTYHSVSEMLPNILPSIQVDTYNLMD